MLRSRWGLAVCCHPLENDARRGTYSSYGQSYNIASDKPVRRRPEARVYRLVSM